MKKTDGLLIGIVVGIVLLVVAAFAVALTKPKPTYLAEDTPEGVSFNYIFALQQEDYERAYGYLSSDILGYPRTITEFTHDVRYYSWNFDNSRTSISIEIGEVRITGKNAIVDLQTSQFYEGGLFDSGQYTDTFTIDLSQDKNGKWKITDSDRYWVYCWNNTDGCN